MTGVVISRGASRFLAACGVVPPQPGPHPRLDVEALTAALCRSHVATDDNSDPPPVPTSGPAGVIVVPFRWR